MIAGVILTTNKPTYRLLQKTRFTRKTLQDRKRLDVGGHYVGGHFKTNEKIGRRSIFILTINPFLDNYAEERSDPDVRIDEVIVNNPHHFVVILNIPVLIFNQALASAASMPHVSAIAATLGRVCARSYAFLIAAFPIAAGDITLSLASQIFSFYLTSCLVVSLVVAV